MAIEYNKNMKFVWYTESKEIEIVESIFHFDESKALRESKQFVFYFRNINELAQLIKSNPKLAKELKELI
jgi:hypothetical protein